MLKTYLKITWRNLLKNKLFSLINICGLAIGIAVCILVFQYVSYEKNYDGFFGNADNLYRLRTDSYVEGKLVGQYGAAMQAVGPIIEKEFPEIIHAQRIMSCAPMIVSYQMRNTFYNRKIYAADEHFLSVFPLPLLKGDPGTALKNPACTVITETMAKKLFRDQEPMGKRLRFGMAIDNMYLDYLVTGVLKDIPENSHLEIDALISMHNIEWTIFDMDKTGEIKWYLPFFQTYVLLKPAADPGALEAKFPAFLEQHAGRIMKKFGLRQLHLQPVRNIHLDKKYEWALGGNGNRKAITIAFWSAVLLLLFSLFNFMNLAIVSSLNRAKEVSIRKAVGAKPMQLFAQFLTESFVLTFLASIIAIFIIAFSLPLFNRLSGMALSNSLFTESGFYLSLFLLIILIIFISAVFLTLILISFNLRTLQDGKYGRYTRGITLRKVLIVSQFIISIVLITGTYNMAQQIKYMLDMELGFNKDKIFVIDADNSRNRLMETWGAVNTFKDELKKVPSVKNVSAAYLHPGHYHGTHQKIKRQDSDKEIHSKVVFIDYDFHDTFSITFLAGKDFTRNYRSDRNYVIINDSLRNVLGFDSPEKAVGQFVILDDRMKFYIKPGLHEIIGVVSDYHQEPLMESIKPTIFYYTRADKAGFYSIKLGDLTNTSQKVASIKKTYDKFFPNNPFEYYFLDEYIDNLYKADKQFEEIIEVTTVLGIVIACLGLLGLSSYTSILRTKEIAMRKVLGASVPGIFSVLSKDFIILILIAIGIATPISFLGLAEFLQNYAYRIGISVWSFIVPYVMILAIAILTLSYQIVRITKVNPAESLKYE